MDVAALPALIVKPCALAAGSPVLTTQQMALILLILGTSAMLLISTRRRMRAARNSPKTYAREQLARLRDEEAVVQNMEELTVQLEEVSRRIQAQLDTKFAKLEAVIRDADDRIERLGRLTRAGDGQPTIDVTVGDDGEAADPTPTDGDDRRQGDHRHRSIFEAADAGRTPLEIAQETGQSTGEIELILALRKSTSDVG